MLTKTDLKMRFWTDSLIRDFGGEPDLKKTNPNHPSGPKMCLWFLSRVEEIETTAEFRAAIEKAKVQIARALKGHETREANSAERQREFENAIAVYVQGEVEPTHGVLTKILSVISDWTNAYIEEAVFNDFGLSITLKQIRDVRRTAKMRLSGNAPMLPVAKVEILATAT